MKIKQITVAQNFVTFRCFYTHQNFVIMDTNMLASIVTPFESLNIFGVYSYTAWTYIKG